MSSADVELVREVLRAWSDDDVEAFRALAHPAVEIVPDPMWLEQTRPTNEAQAMEFFADYRREFAASRLEVLELREGPHGVLARFEDLVTGRQSGASVMNRSSILARVRDGRVTHVQFFLDHDEALRAAGLD